MYSQIESFELVDIVNFEFQFNFLLFLKRERERERKGEVAGRLRDQTSESCRQISNSAKILTLTFLVYVSWKEHL